MWFLEGYKLGSMENMYMHACSRVADLKLEEPMDFHFRYIIGVILKIPTPD